MKIIVIKNKGLSIASFAEAFDLLFQNYSHSCHMVQDGDRIIVYYNPERTYSVDAGAIVPGATATKLAIRYYLKDYINNLEIVCEEEDV